MSEKTVVFFVLFCFVFLLQLMLGEMIGVPRSWLGPQWFVADHSKSVLSLWYFLFNVLSCFTYKCFCFNNYVS